MLLCQPTTDVPIILVILVLDKVSSFYNSLIFPKLNDCALQGILVRLDFCIPVMYKHNPADILAVL